MAFLARVSLISHQRLRWKTTVFSNIHLHNILLSVIELFMGTKYVPTIVSHKKQYPMQVLDGFQTLCKANLPGIFMQFKAVVPYPKGVKKN